MAKVKLQVMILSARRGKGVIESNNRPYSFTKFYAISSETDEENLKGYNVEEYKGEYELFEKISTLPARYELECDWDGKRMTVLDLQHLEDVEIIGL